MGDRYDREASSIRRRQGGAKPPELILNWGLAPSQTGAAPAALEQPPAPVGHNGGPPIDAPADLWVRYNWTVAHRAAWKNPPMDILRFRVARAEAAGVSYREYMLTLRDTGRHLQKADVEAHERAASDGGPDASRDTPERNR